ncbi:helix-turn-helix domain-containing protein [Sulfurospirillum arcachonense]|uniref:helix-turn-helix domain-containing protein n=1 Tax=Sulfurospirillum arcachonense TaxID=57666 RepID=UPI0004694CDD|nr:helix-turn-helix domain-containing protein [Sulfurospirillum arcachonense]
MEDKKSSYSVKFWQPNIQEDVTFYKSHLNNCGFDKHIHDEHTVSIIKHGVMDSFLKGSKQKINNFYVTFINPDEVHSNASQYKNEYQSYSIYLKPSYIQKLLHNSFNNKEIFFNKGLLEDKQLAQKLLNLVEQDEQKQISKLDFECRLVQLLNKIFLENTSAKIYTKLTAHDTMIQKAKEYMNDNYQLNLSLDDIASELDVSKYHFLRLFKEKTFISPHAYLMLRRLERAKHSLQKGESIITTAYDCGFNDQSHLHRRFKAVTGATPKQYQNFFK